MENYLLAGIFKGGKGCVCAGEEGGGGPDNESRLYFGHYNGSQLQLYGLITNHEKTCLITKNERLNFEAITDHDKTLYHPVF